MGMPYSMPQDWVTELLLCQGEEAKPWRKDLKMLNVPHVFLGAGNKMEVFNEFIKTYKINPEDVLYVGDDIPDFKVMEKVGLAVCPADAAEEIKKISDYISHYNGGEGCVREIIEQVLKVQGKWMTDEAHIW